MACVGDKILAAPFAIIGSIGVVAQLPNFHRFLKKRDIDFELLTAGEYKRTLTIFGENTAKAREKTQDDLEEIHHLFKAFIQANRKQVDIAVVATGAHWLAKDALTLKLVDKLMTSDDYLNVLAASDEAEIYECQYLTKKSVAEKLSSNVQSALDKFISWALAEWIRSWILTGFPWLLLGTSQVSTPLSGYAPILGIVGLTFLVALSASLLLSLFYPFLNKRFNCQFDLKNFYYSGCLLALIGLWAIGYLLSFIPWTHIQGKPIQISLIQANIPQEIKWEPEYQKASLLHYQQLTQSHWDSRLIIWPEAAIPLLQNQAVDFLKQLDKQAKQHTSTLITGIPIQKGFQYYNGMLALGLDHATYYKQRLVIFGEYLPWWIIWAHGLLNLLDIPMSSFSPGPSHQPAFNVANVNLGTFICYEIAYSNLVRQALQDHAQLLLTINDDAWFGHSFALAQHLQIGQFQALTTGRYLAFLSNTGLTAIVTPKGKIIAKLPPFETGVLTGSIYKTSGLTPWVYLGDGSIIIFLVGLCILCYAYRKAHI
ncbi:hypothetical protein FQR65_LT05243 [Abscondita terminalis]|nr:hypothetical protein FQR65_LT05243 [Abscondita terminalis]